MPHPADEPTLRLPPEATILIPRPGGQATQVARPRPQAERRRRPRVAAHLQRLVAGVNPLLGAAGTLLALLPQLRATRLHGDPDALQAQLLRHVSEFEATAAANGVPRLKISAARYLLCSLLDEVVAQTPWGGSGVWAQRNLLQAFHEERWGGAKAFELLERLGRDPAANADLLELFYVCLQLGFEGRYRGTPHAREQLDALSARVLEVMRPGHDGLAVRQLALQWQGVAAPRAAGIAAVPLWVLLAGCAALVLALGLAAALRLQGRTQPALRQIHAAVAAAGSERAQPAARPRLAGALAADVSRGALGLRELAQRSVVTLPADALFVPGSAEIDPAQSPMLARVAAALKALPGEVAVVGHTDDSRPASLRFPSNWHLSQARALAVVAALAQQGLPAERLHAEGRGDAEPAAGNDTPEGRARNRRVEVELRLPRPQP